MQISVREFFKQNGYIEYHRLSSLQVPNPSAFLKQKFSADEGVHLETLFVSNTIVQQVPEKRWLSVSCALTAEGDGATGVIRTECGRRQRTPTSAGVLG